MASTAVRQRLPDGGAEYHLIGPIMVFELPDARLCGLLGESGLTLAEREHFRAELPGPARPSIQFSMQYARMPCRALGMERAAHLRFEFASLGENELARPPGRLGAALARQAPGRAARRAR